MMGDRSRPDPLRFGNTVSIGSSAGWTDEKHMHYITSMEESFLNQLYKGKVDSKELFGQSPEENSIAYYMDHDSSTNSPQKERTSNPPRSKNSGRLAASYLRWNGHSLPRRTEGSGQNFVDGDTEGTDEHSRGCREKRQKQKAGSTSSSREDQGPKRWSM